MTARPAFRWIDALSAAGFFAAIYVVYELLLRADWNVLTLDNALVAGVGIAVGVVALMLSGAALSATAASFGDATHLSIVHAIYAANKTVLAKYLPGKIWYVFGMSEILAQTGLGRRRAWIVVTVYQCILIFTALALGVVAALGTGPVQVAWTTLARVPFRWSIVGIVVVAVAFAFVLVIYLHRRWRSTVPKVLGGWMTCGAVFSVAHWMLQGLAIWLILSLLYGSWLDWNTILIVPAVYAAGFLVLIAPGGAGIREFLFFQYFLYLGLSTESSATLAILARAAALAIECATWLLLHAMPRRFRAGTIEALE